MQEKRKAGSTSTGEVPPASCVPEKPPGLAPACGGVDATVHHAALHPTGRDRLLADDRLGKLQQQPPRYQWCTECGNSLLAPCTLLHPVAS